MQQQSESLRRFTLEGILDEGAELQVFAATDAETGRPVVVKRPHPAWIARQQHRDVEQRLAKTIAVRAQLGDTLPHVPQVVAHTASQNHDAYFGDSLAQSYTVLVEERARGVPLVASAVDGIKGAPVGLPQNLFALHPLVPHPQTDAFAVCRAITEVAAAFDRAGHLLLDLSPLNVFYDPTDAKVTVIDVSNVAVERPSTHRRGPLDMHDVCLELFKWFTTSEDPTQDPGGYAIPHGMESVSMFARDLERMTLAYSQITWEPLKAAALAILERLRQRSYEGFDDFKRDFGTYLDLATEKYQDLARSDPLISAWRQASDRLGDPYWSKYLFDPAASQAPYLES